MGEVKENCADNDDSVRLVILNLPEDEGEGLGFRLTRTMWDPYPWVRDIVSGSRADAAGLKTGDCLLQADGKDLLGLPVGQVAGLIRGDGSSRGVSLVAWNCGVDPKDDPELLWSCGGGVRGERSRRALSGVIKALACCVCAATATKPLSCNRSHLYCEACWCRLDRCALCREQLPAKNSPQARNLVAEQVFEAIATEYEIKGSLNRRKETTSSLSTLTRSPSVSPVPQRRGQYQLSLMNKQRVTFNDKLTQNLTHSDPNIRKTLCCNSSHKNSTPFHTDATNVPQIKIEDADDTTNCKCSSNCSSLYIPHKLVTRLKSACSLVNLQNLGVQECHLSKSLNNVNINSPCGENSLQGGSLDDLKRKCSPSCDSPLLVISPTPVYLLACEHSRQ